MKSNLFESVVIKIQKYKTIRGVQVLNAFDAVVLKTDQSKVRFIGQDGYA